MASSEITVILDRDTAHSDLQPVSPTDISQFIRLDQCQRFLRLQLHLRQHGDTFLHDYDVALQSIPPILTHSGATFEDAVEADLTVRFPATKFHDEERKARGESSDNAALVRLAGTLQPGQVHILLQPRLDATVDRWRIRGDVDILRLERNQDGSLQCLIVDMKSSTSTKIEHRLQVAMYHEMLTAILGKAGIVHLPIALAVLYRGPVEGTTAAESMDPELQEAQQADAEATLGTRAGQLERIDDIPSYVRSVRDLLTGPISVARRVLDMDFDAIPFHLTYKCDGCRFNEFCLKRTAETDDLSLIPHLTEQDKTNLISVGITNVQGVADLKTQDATDKTKLAPAPGQENRCRQLATTWPIGQHLDEVIHRAHRYVSWKRGGEDGLGYIPHRGYGTLPAHNETLHPNLVKVYIDAQHDYLLDRIYMLGSLVVACNNGVEDPDRRRSIVRMTKTPPHSNAIERDLFIDWIQETIRAVTELAAPNAEGEASAPVHLVFVNQFAQKQLLNGLGRYLDTILGVTALYDFITQLAMFDSPLASFLEREIREQKNYPMVCQSLQAVASYLGFKWDEDIAYREFFRARMFDFWRKHDEPTAGERAWYTGRSRFNSQIPLEYAYAAWGELEPGADPDALAFYELTTPGLMTGFHARRLEAMEHIAHQFRGNHQTELRSFSLPDLGTFAERAATLAHALDEFVHIERFVELGAWKQARLAPPEQRVLNGDSLIVRYVEADQAEGVAAQNRENAKRMALNEQFRAEFKAAHPDAKQVRLPREQKEASTWSPEGLEFRLRLETSGLACDLEDVLNLTTLKSDSRMVLQERWSVDSRLPEAQRSPFTSTAKQLLYGPRVELKRIEKEHDERGVCAAFAVVEMVGGGGSQAGFLFGGSPRPLRADTVYTLEPDPSDINGFWQSRVVSGLISGEENTLYSWLVGESSAEPATSDVATDAQRAFMVGLDALHRIDQMYPFESSKHDFIGDHGNDQVLLVQGPPGTGKSFSTAYALLGRIQGAMAADAPARVMISCKTHAATDVLLGNVLEARERLRHLFASHPELMGRYFDRRLLDIPLFRIRPRGDLSEGITSIGHEMKQKDARAALTAHLWSVTASTPGGIYNTVKDSLFGHKFLDWVVLDEASQMSIPEALMATLPLKPGGRIIVVGDHRQMPPIVKHDWAHETRRTFQQFKSYESLFVTLINRNPPRIHFEESFRLHADLAEFLRKEIYSQDKIAYHSNLHDTIPQFTHADPFVTAALAPSHPLTVIVHDEGSSQHRNAYEQALITPILTALADDKTYGYTPTDGLGVVVPHRSQRAALRGSIPELSLVDPETGDVLVSAVDTVERFQGDERMVILISATESDPEYLLLAGDFLLDPRRLTVALSRAKRKMILVAGRSVFELFSADEETFRNAQIWKNLLHNTCTHPLWEGKRNGHRVEVWGNASPGSGL